MDMMMILKYIWIYLKIIKTVVFVSFFVSFSLFFSHILLAARSERRESPKKNRGERREGQNKDAFAFFLVRSMPMNEWD